MMQKKTKWLVFTGLMLPIFSAAAAVPADGLIAEGEKNWSQAVVIYQQSLQKNPQQPELWKRIGDIEAHLNHSQKAAIAFAKYAELEPDNAEAQFQSSQAYAVTKQPKKALAAVQRAVKLKPQDLTYLQAQTQLANWAGDPSLAEATYRKILIIDPTNQLAMSALKQNKTTKRSVDKKPLDEQARALAILHDYVQHNQLDRAAIGYEQFLQRYPEVPQAWLDYASINSWRGDFRTALQTLDQYQARFGADEKYLAERARILALAARWKSSLKIVDPLLQKNPNDYGLLYTKAYAQNYANQYSEALTTLNYLTELKPDSNDTKTLNDFIRTPLRSNLNFNTYHSDDSDQVEITKNLLNGTYYFNPETALIAGIKYEYLTAPETSGLNNINGTSGVYDNNGWIGFTRFWTPAWYTRMRVGTGNIQGVSSFGMYDIDINRQLGQQGYISLGQFYDVYNVSARAVSLGIKQRATVFNMAWQPWVQRYLNITGEYDTYTDTNQSLRLTVNPSFAAVRAQYVNINLGLIGHVLSFSQNLNNGYYDPHFYQRYQAAAMAYFQQSYNVGYSFQAAFGPQRDSNFPHYGLALDFSGSAFIGIYKSWYLQLGAGKSIRTEGGGITGASGGYQSEFVTAILTKRF